ncbi:hypothetical protein [Elizabethkingia meningoseptica]|uniref:hypothetical protein n=1 Tax=Elizabethkingia meningoseptica TaxID=238 RepID=UPI002012FB27|nr:hypothetical protein [Elizabethkingia meningoseptica]MCL1674159.1 hypothetical protein [Elizabethkingia meningoseptica]MCL1685200.1 hypothetical protein [Elizabethkingia meningoseptica]
MISYLVLILEYVLTRSKGVIYNILIAVFVSILFYVTNIDTNTVIEMSKNAVDLLGILLGFTISMFAIILSVNSDIIAKAKETFLKVKLYKQPFSLYDRLIAGIAFVIFLFSFLLIYNFIFPIIYVSFLKQYVIFFIINIGAIIFSILELLSCIINYYLLITNKKKNSNY